MQPKKYSNPKIVLLNVELELKAEKTNAEIRIDNVEVSRTFGNDNNLLWCTLCLFKGLPVNR